MALRKLHSDKERIHAYSLRQQLSRLALFPSISLSFSNLSLSRQYLMIFTLSTWISSVTTHFHPRSVASGDLCDADPKPPHPSVASKMNRRKCFCAAVLLLILLTLRVSALEEDRAGKIGKSSVETQPGTKNKFQKSTETFKSSITKLKKSHKKIDLVFLVDSSSSVGKSNFVSEIKFVKKVLADLTVSYKTTRVGIVSFSSVGKVVSERRTV